MATTSISESFEPPLVSRRDAIKRAAAMLGIALSPAMVSAVLQAQTAPKANAARYLSATQFATAAAIAERILPKTDTPGAADVGVPAFLDLMFGEFMMSDEKSMFAAGLAEVERMAQAGHQRAFAQLTGAEQDAILTRIAKASQDQEKTFFHLIKDTTLIGYFTSEPIGRKVLHYDPIPGRYEGCIPLSEVGNVSWTR